MERLGIAALAYNKVNMIHVCCQTWISQLVRLCQNMPKLTASINHHLLYEFCTIDV